jgi:integrase
MPLKLVPPRAGKSPNWTIRGSYCGIPVDRSTKTHREAAARRKLKETIEAIERGEYPPKRPEPDAPTFLIAAVNYMRSGGERENVGRLIAHFGEKPLAEIGQTEIDAAALELYPNAAPATRNRKIYTPVSAILHTSGIDIRLKRPAGAKGRIVTQFLRPEDAAAIISAAEQEDPAFATLLALLVYSGCRIGEVMRMKIEDLNLDRRWAYIGKTKNGDPRTVLLRSSLVGPLQDVVGGRTEGPLWPFRAGGGLKDRLVRAKLRACGVAVPKRQKGKSRRIPHHRLSWAGFHAFRHTWATWMRRYGKTDVHGLVATGNWRDPRSAARYQHVAAHKEWALVEELPDVMWKIRGKGKRK